MVSRNGTFMRENKYPNEAPCPGGTAHICIISTICFAAHKLDWSSIEWFFFLFAPLHFDRTHWQVVWSYTVIVCQVTFQIPMANDPAFCLRKSRPSQHKPQSVSLLKPEPQRHLKKAIENMLGKQVCLMKGECASLLWSDMELKNRRCVVSNMFAKQKPMSL